MRRPRARPTVTDALAITVGFMSPSMIVVLILVVGIALVIAASLADRRSQLRASGREPGRPTVAPGGEDREEPAYQTAQQLLDNAPPAARFTPDQERELADQLASAVRVECRLATELLATHTGGRMIVDQPRVLVCSDQISEIRELLRLLSDASADRSPLVIAAAAIDADTLQTLVANKLAGTVEVAVLLGDESALAELAQAAGSPLVTVDDRRSGVVKVADLGRPARVVADANACWAIQNS